MNSPSPDQTSVYALMNPAVEGATAMQGVTSRLSTALTTYAAELEEIKPTLADLEERAAAFRKEALKGYEVSNWDARGFFGNFDTGLDGNPVPKDDAYETTTIPWNEHGPAVDKNNALWAEHNGILAKISAAATTCANSISGELTLVCQAPAEALTPEMLNNSPDFSHWGQPVTEDRNCTESMGKGLGDFWHSTWTGAASIIGRDAESGEWSWGVVGRTLGGIGDFALSTILVATPFASAATLLPEGNPLRDFMQDRMNTAASAWGSLIGWDHQAALAGGNGWHKWEEDGIAALTESFASIGTFFIPGPGWVAGGARTVLAGTRVAELGSRVAAVGTKVGAVMIKVGGRLVDLVISGGSHLTAGAVHVIDLGATGIKNGWRSVVEMLRPADNTHPNPTSTVDTSPSRIEMPERTPVSDALGLEPTPVKSVDGSTPHAMDISSQHPGTGKPGGSDDAPVVPRDGTDSDGSDRNSSTKTDTDPNAKAPDGGPLRDSAGREYWFDENGRRHLDGDPHEFYRDKAGRLRDESGWVTDPNKPDTGGMPTERAVKGETERGVEVGDADRAAIDELAQKRDAAQAVSKDATKALNSLLDDFKVDRSIVKQSVARLEKDLTSLVDDGSLDMWQMQELLGAVDDTINARHEISKLSEPMGETSAQAVAKSKDEFLLVSDSKPGSGRVDLATLADGNPPALVIYEAKGAGSTPGYRVVDGCEPSRGPGGT